MLKYAVTGITALIALTALTAAPDFTGLFHGDQDTVVYCPTMSEHTSKIPGSYDAKEVESSSKAFRKVREQEASAALTGRPATNRELPGAEIKKLEPGKTIVTRRRQAITASELEDRDLHTYLPDKRLEDIDIDVVRHKSWGEAVEKGLEEAVIVDWDDYRGEPLLVVKNGEEKDGRFRTPFLHYPDE